MKYPLPACILFEAECKAILFPVIRAALPKADIAAYISSDYRDGNIDCLSVGVISSFHCMGTAIKACLIDQISRKTQLVNIMISNIEDLVVDAGLFGS